MYALLRKVVYKRVVGEGGGASHCPIGPYRAGERKMMYSGSTLGVVG